MVAMWRWIKGFGEEAWINDRLMWLAVKAQAGAATINQGVANCHVS